MLVLVQYSALVSIFMNAIIRPKCYQTSLIDNVIVILYRKGDGALRASYTLERTNQTSKILSASPVFYH